MPHAGELRRPEKGRRRRKLSILAETADKDWRPPLPSGRSREYRRDPAVPRRRGAQRQQGWRPQLQGNDRLDQRRLLSDRAPADKTELPDGVNAVLEVVLDGLDAPTINARDACRHRRRLPSGVKAIGAGNYGGKLGPYHFHLRQVMADTAT